MGTIVCQHLAAAQPKLVRSLALFGPLIAPPDAARAAIRARAAKARSEGAAGMHEIALGAAATPRSRPTRAQRLPLAVAFVRESLMRQDPDGYARSCEALADAQAAAVERIEAPVLLVTGDEDGVAPPQAVRAMAEKLHRRKQHARRGAAALRPLDADRAARGMRARAARLPRRRNAEEGDRDGRRAVHQRAHLRRRRRAAVHRRGAGAGQPHRARRASTGYGARARAGRRRAR